MAGPFGKKVVHGTFLGVKIAANTNVAAQGICPGFAENLATDSRHWLMLSLESGSITRFKTAAPLTRPPFNGTPVERFGQCHNQRRADYNRPTGTACERVRRFQWRAAVRWQKVLIERWRKIYNTVWPHRPGLSEPSVIP